jgi:hypothetical protein
MPSPMPSSSGLSLSRRRAADGSSAQDGVTPQPAVEIQVGHLGARIARARLYRSWTRGGAVCARACVCFECFAFGNNKISSAVHVWRRCLKTQATRQNACTFVASPAPPPPPPPPPPPRTFVPAKLGRRRSDADLLSPPKPTLSFAAAFFALMMPTTDGIRSRA